MVETGKRHCTELKIISKPRIHLTLLSMHENIFRINGGMGYSVDSPNCEISFSKSKNFFIYDNRKFPSSAKETDQLLTFLRSKQISYGFEGSLEVSISGNMRPHAGFGSGTAVTLACLEALHILNGSEISPAELVAASGRGGTSGVGIHSYFSGGYVFDLGRKVDGSPFSPSHLNGSKPAPLLLDQGPMPDWEFGICMPAAIAHKTQAEERDFFRRTCPLPADKVYETVYHTLFGLYAALREADRSAFCAALKSVQNCAWKLAERREYGKALLELEQAIYAAGADAVGMSSLGPSLFFLADDVNSVVAAMRQSRPDCDWLVTRPDNLGREIVYG
ncbi:beta-ribofuranosylaminobenzene 5'-phosphate synthase [Methylomonas sp. WSC-6]|uniref:Beta-ribofuranosylaminobenzene 5'-phosphate synthase n=2 Tax=Methylomonas rivi TaxID=2952226 RepID=A0ABT1U709_9GAMM|nr:beta-ribofuranosylaminobenzene 5'-phosphate synthase family protein [Methylomonas sp. WSC-6]MCQ8129646.1 beta-ribofuranosylaminobenzene 5'-phosphate synthase [Methylomonas sp. WSC-6]